MRKKDDELRRIKDAGGEELLRLEERRIQTIDAWREANEVVRSTPSPLYDRAIELRFEAIEECARVGVLYELEAIRLRESSNQPETRENS